MNRFHELLDILNKHLVAINKPYSFRAMLNRRVDGNEMLFDVTIEYRFNYHEKWTPFLRVNKSMDTRDFTINVDSWVKGLVDLAYTEFIKNIIFSRTTDNNFTDSEGEIVPSFRDVITKIINYE